MKCVNLKKNIKVNLFLLKNKMAEKKDYLYGRIQKRDGSGDDESQKDMLVIYVKPTIFHYATLSSLEGIFKSDETNLERTKCMGWNVPQFHFKKERMKEVATKYQGKFVPFEK
jgi:hypothetical protein